MKKTLLLIMCTLALTIAPTLAAPAGGGGHSGGHGGASMGGHNGSMGSHGGGAMGHGGGAMHSPAGNRTAGMPAGHIGARPANMGHAPIHGGVHYIGVRPMPIHRHYPLYRPYYPYYPYYSYYYPTYYSTYSYYPADYVYDDVPVATEGGTVVVRDNYAGVNATANVINAAANAAAAIKFLTW